jgi:hypothetical protein
MGKLLERLSDPAKSGVYRAPDTLAVLEATRGSDIRVARIDLSGADKAALLERVARALQFPAWFGGNWDALEDCLTDLSWAPAPGYVLLFEGAATIAADDRGALQDILASSAEFWAERRRPFFAVFVGQAAGLPRLYRGAE